VEIEAIVEASTLLANRTDCDILFYSGDIERPFDEAILDMCLTSRRRKNVLLILCTRGGNPDAAYRIARCLQNNYATFTVLLHGRCKSAGTLIAIGAHELAMTDYAELGPLDIQLGKKDELFEADSGLTILKALTELENKAFELFETCFLRIKVKSEGSITFKTASTIATELAKGIVAPIMAHVDPMHVGEVSRAMQIGKEYGQRLSSASKNLKDRTLDRLVDDYPSHGFVIDRKEACSLFVNVRESTDEELNLLNLLGPAVRTPRQDDPVLFFVSQMKGEVSDDCDHSRSSGEEEVRAGTGDGAAQEALRNEEQTRSGIVTEIDAGQKAGT
jgi:hypothetical protein